MNLAQSKIDTHFIRGADLIRLRDIMQSGFLQNADNVNSLYYQSLFIESLIILRYLLTAWEKEGATPVVNFNEDIAKTKDYDNINGLIAFFRNTVCHSASSNKQRSSDGGIMYILQDNRDKRVFIAGGVELSKYDDEVAAIAGDNVLLIKRHLVRAYNEIYSAMIADKRFDVYKQLINQKIKAGR